ncbi:MAG TPA: hypothetical protein VFT37_04845 [Telluria sp.]|nr:hypothetical protein [Telluria sp.]
MRSHLLRTLVAVAVASTLAACGHQRDTMDTASDATLASPTAMDQGAAAAPAPVSSEMTASTATPVDATATTADTQTGATTSGQTASSTAQPAQPTATASPEQYPGAAPTTMSTYQQPVADAQASTGMAPSVQYDPSGAMKTEIIEGSVGQMGASGAGATASSADQQSMCDMYGRLKSATSTEERESIMSRILLDMPKNGTSSGLGGVREQCAG